MTVQTATQPDPTRKIIEECKRETQIRYKSKGNTFFRARMRGVNSIQVGKSKIINSPLTITLEWIFQMYRRLRKARRRFAAELFLRHPELPVGHRDSRLVGRIVFAGDRGQGPPIYNLHLEFWGRTYWFAWRKISEGRTDAKGCFALPFPLRAARNLAMRSLSLEIQKTTRVYFEDGAPHFHFDLFNAIPIAKSDLIGLDYNLRTIPLDYWLYDPGTVTPRAVVDEFRLARDLFPRPGGCTHRTGHPPRDHQDQAPHTDRTRPRHADHRRYRERLSLEPDALHREAPPRPRPGLHARRRLVRRADDERHEPRLFRPGRRAAWPLLDPLLRRLLVRHQ